MRVLISAESFTPNINGVTNSVLRSVKHLVERGHHVRIVAPAPGPFDVDLHNGQLVPVDRVRSRQLRLYDDLTYGIPPAAQVEEILLGFKPDVVHLAAPMVLGRRVGAVAARFDIPTVAFFQTDFAGFACDYGLSVAEASLWAWTRKVHNRADLTLAPTETVARQLRRKLFKRVGVWGRGVDHAQFDASRRSEAFRASCGVPAGSDRVLVGYVGRLAREKGIDRLQGLDRTSALRLTAVGDGPDRDRLQRLLPAAHFTGFRTGDALGEAMASLDVFVHTGERETFCQTIQEAMSCGVPVVAPASGGPIDLVDHGVNGFLYPPGDSSALRDSVLRIAADPQLRQRMGEAARLKVADRSWDAISDQLIDWYQAAIDTHSPPPEPSHFRPLAGAGRGSRWTR